MNSQNATAYPLAWPIGQPRTPYLHRLPATRFSSTRTMAQARTEMIDELYRLGAYQVTISTNLELRGDGLPRADRGQPADPGVAVYFLIDGQPHVLACDRWNMIRDNMWAIRLHIEALRGTDRWGVGRANQAFAGYRQLMAPPQIDDPWWEVLNCSEHSPLEYVEQQYRELAKVEHPDAGGSNERMAKLNKAIATAREKLT